MTDPAVITVLSVLAGAVGHLYFRQQKMHAALETMRERNGRYRTGVQIAAGCDVPSCRTAKALSEIITNYPQTPERDAEWRARMEERKARKQGGA